MTAANPSTRDTPPTVAQTYALVKQLTAEQRDELLFQIRQDLWADVQAAAEQVQAQMEADGITITDEEIDAEVKAVRAERYAAGQR